MQTKPEAIIPEEHTQTVKPAWREPRLQEINHLATESGNVSGAPEGQPTSLGVGHGSDLS